METKNGKQIEGVSAPKVTGEVGVTTKPAGVISPGQEMKRLVALAKTDLATQLSISETDIETMQAEFVTWRDSSAGCPQPGMQFMQVLTNGARIRLRANKADYHYHSGGNRAPFLCKNPSPVDPLPYQDDKA